MADVVANIAKGRVIELFRRVKVDGGTNRLYVAVWSGAVADDSLRDCDTFSALTSAGLTKLTSNGWTQKELAAADLGTFDANLDDTNNWFDLDVGDQTWTSVSSGTSTRLIFGYAATSGATDANITPLTIHDFAVTPDGSDVVAVINTEGFFRAA